MPNFTVGRRPPRHVSRSFIVVVVVISSGYGGLSGLRRQPWSPRRPCQHLKRSIRSWRRVRSNYSPTYAICTAQTSTICRCAPLVGPCSCAKNRSERVMTAAWTAITGAAIRVWRQRCMLLDSAKYAVTANRCELHYWELRTNWSLKFRTVRRLQDCTDHIYRAIERLFGNVPINIRTQDKIATFKSLFKSPTTFPDFPYSYRQLTYTTEACLNVVRRHCICDDSRRVTAPYNFIVYFYYLFIIIIIVIIICNLCLSFLSHFSEYLQTGRDLTDREVASPRIVW